MEEKALTGDDHLLIITAGFTYVEMSKEKLKMHYMSSKLTCTHL